MTRLWNDVGRACLQALMIFAAPVASVAAGPETPVPLGACQIGTLRINAATTGSDAVAQLKRAFPGAVVTTTVEYGWRRRAEFLVQGRPLLTLYMHTSGDHLIAIDLRSSRFQLAPGVYPGAPIVQAEHTLGAAEVEMNPSLNSEEILTFANVDRLGWTAAGCSVELYAGPGRVGRYPAGEYDTRRFRPGAAIQSIKIAP